VAVNGLGSQYLAQFLVLHLECNLLHAQMVACVLLCLRRQCIKQVQQLVRTLPKSGFGALAQGRRC